MRIVSLTVKEAEEFLAQHERHYKAPAEPICALGVGEGDAGTEDEQYEPERIRLHGAAILGRRNAYEAELTHIYVDGTSQGYSLLYGACWRALKALGYQKAWL